MDTSRLQAAIAVQHLKDAHVVGDWESETPGSRRFPIQRVRRHPLTGEVYARISYSRQFKKEPHAKVTSEVRDDGTKAIRATPLIHSDHVTLTVWDRTKPNAVEVLREERWDTYESAQDTADHMLKVQGVFFLADLMEP